MNKLVEISFDVDDFCRVFIPQWEKQCLEDGTRQRKRTSRMSMSEIIVAVAACIILFTFITFSKMFFFLRLKK